MKSTKLLKPAVILVADRTLTGKYDILFEGIFATMQTTSTPELAMKTLVSPKIRCDQQGRAWQGALGLRRIESALLAQTDINPDDIVCTTPERLNDLISSNTKLVIVSSSDPLGIGMSNTTTTSFWSGQLYTKLWTDQMLQGLKPLKEKYGFTVWAGGAGAWQWAHDQQTRHEQGIDFLYEGYFESDGPAIAKKILAGQMPENDHHIAKSCAVEKVSPIKYASLMGIVELSRGCGKGCNFCTMAQHKMEHLPADIILADIQTNVSQGMPSTVMGSEDFFRYGAKGFKPNFAALADLLSQMQAIKGLKFAQIDHGNISTILQYSDCELKEIRRLMSLKNRTDYLWVNMGIESANGHLVQANSPGKMLPFAPENWSEMTLEVADKMIRCGFFPVFSIVLGLPGETANDIELTQKLINELIKKRCVIFPIFYEPVLPGEIQTSSRFSTTRMTQKHLDLYVTCYEQNFKNVPPMYWDNQKAGGVSWPKRALIRTLGKTEVAAWRKNFKKLRPKLPQ